MIKIFLTINIRHPFDESFWKLVLNLFKEKTTILLIFNNLIDI